MPLSSSQGKHGKFKLSYLGLEKEYSNGTLLSSLTRI